MKLRRSTNQLVIGAALVGMMMSHTPAVRADVEDGEVEVVVQTPEGGLGFLNLEDFYLFLREYFEDDEEDDEDLEDEEFEDEDIDGEEFEDEDSEDDLEEEEEIDEDDLEDEEDFEDEEDVEDAEELEDEDFEEEEDSDEESDEEGDEDSEFACAETEDDVDEENDMESEDEDASDECGYEPTPDVGFGFNNTNPVADDTVYLVPRHEKERTSRFLQQATLGANYPLITQVANQGREAWLEDQFLEPVGLTMPYAQYLVDRLEAADEQGGEAAIDQIFEEQGIPEDYFGYSWWTQVMTSPDLVRQRVATALTEIFVIGRTVEEIGENPIALATFYDMLLNNSFGNFRDLLLDVTLNPSMGIYLSHFGNAKADPEKGTYPDENYAREVMQLFSIGLFELNADGSRKLDGNGNPIATYDNDDIREFAKVFTGLGNGGEDPSFAQPTLEIDLDLSKPMAMYESYHDSSEKKLLNGTVLPSGQSGLQDIYGAVDNLFNHPNTGPFIGRLLIQRLVTSNPSPEYIARVSAAFNGENGDPRGDMKAVIRAILLDPEARNSPNRATAQQGKLREPMLRAVHLARAFNATSHDRTFNGTGYTLRETTKQWIFASPSVFNFFQPDYAPLGEISQQNLVAPEFQITSASSIIGVKNYLSFALSEDGPLEEEGSAAIARFDFTRELSLSDEALVNRLNTKLTYGTLSSATQAAVLEAIAGLEGEERVRTAIYLVMISPDYTTAI